MSHYVEALIWMDEQMPMDDAEFLVRMAKPTRWTSARFAPSDVDRAERAIRADAHYLGMVATDAMMSARRSGVGLRRVQLAVRRTATVEAT